MFGFGKPKVPLGTASIVDTLPGHGRPHIRWEDTQPDRTVYIIGSPCGRRFIGTGGHQIIDGEPGKCIWHLMCGDRQGDPDPTRYACNMTVMFFEGPPDKVPKTMLALGKRIVALPHTQFTQWYAALRDDHRRDLAKLHNARMQKKGVVPIRGITVKVEGNCHRRTYSFPCPIPLPSEG